VSVENISIYDELLQSFRESKLNNKFKTFVQEAKLKNNDHELKGDFRDINLFKNSITGTVAPFLSGEHSNIIFDARERVAL